MHIQLIQRKKYTPKQNTNLHILSFGKIQDNIHCFFFPQTLNINSQTIRNNTSSSSSTTQTLFYNVHLAIGQTNHVTMIVVRQRQLFKTVLVRWKTAGIDLRDEIYQCHYNICGSFIVLQIARG